MKRMLFIGACDKSDLLLYVSKVLTKLDQKILIVDATLRQFYQFSISQLDHYYKVTEYEGFDVASGFASFAELQEYYQAQQEKFDAYDYLLIDTDHPEQVGNWPGIEHHLLVTNLEKRTILRNAELMRQLFATKDQTLVRFFKVILQAVNCQIDEDYIESTLTEFPIQWTEPSYAVYWDDVDYATKIDNQFNNRLQIKSLSKAYKEVIMELAGLISGLKEQEIKTAWKLAERRK